MTVTAIQLDRARQAAPQVYERLREQIIALTLAPGSVLARNELMVQFGVSQTPIRDALLRLAEEGLVDIFPQHATVVSPIDLAAARQAHFLRRSVELEVVRTLALRADRSFVAPLRTLIARQRAMLDAEDFEAFAETDQLLHRQLCEAAEVSGLWTLIRSRSGHLDRLRRLHLPVPGKAQSILNDHARILDAIAAGDADGAQEALRQHLSGTLAQVDEIRARFPDYVRG
ncbi:GntR family transcriptional regulator [Inquilinus sp. Marseille-Q2685]|uniref:GntR family transcriptional regulator n=1 Tax=Inquilinus sp. Marseille-Q2685 TaxID=2866581 RepID=UPI001CE4964B|nr:GntR family transcriptional regulator [Inquilinus sp. Marseille-Q2685]